MNKTIKILYKIYVNYFHNQIALFSGERGLTEVRFTKLEYHQETVRTSPQ